MTLEDKFLSQPQLSRIYFQEKFIMSITDAICQALSDKGISRLELAERLGKDSKYIDQFLDGATEMPIREVADFFFAIDTEPLINT